MQLDLTDEETSILLTELNAIIETTAFPLSARIRMLRRSRAKLPEHRARRHRRERRHAKSASEDEIRARDGGDTRRKLVLE
jgi:hypothetical protein